MKPDIPICAECRREYRINKNGVIWVQQVSGMPQGAYWCDRWKCPGCGHRILRGFGHVPFTTRNDEVLIEARLKLEADRGSEIFYEESPP